MKRLRRWICLLGAVFFALSTHAPASGENGLANPIGAADSLVMAGSELYFSAGTNLYRWDGTGAAVPVARGVEGELTGGGDALYLLSLRQRRLTRLAADEAGHLSPCQTYPLDNPKLLDATGALRSLMGYALDLSVSTILRDAAGSYYPFLSDALHAPDGTLAAMPLGALWCPVLYEFYPDAWREAGLEVPTTAAGLLDACIAFSRRDDLLSDGWRLFMDLSEASVLKRQTLQIVLQSYLTEFAADDGYVEIDTPAFRALLQKYEEALPALDRIAALTEPPGPNGYDAEEAAKTCLLSALSPDLLPQEERGVESAFLLLTVTGESEAVVGADATVLVVNPASPNRELAVAYLECYAQGLGAHERIQYMPDEAAPVERDSYGAEQTLLAEEEAAVLSALAQAEPEDESGLRARLASVRENLRALEEHRYATTPEQIAKYKRLAPRLRIFKDLGLNFFMRLSPEMATLLNQYMEGAVDTERFIARYAAMARMIYLENSPR